MLRPDSKQPGGTSAVQFRANRRFRTRPAGAKHNEIEGKDSRKQNRRADMHCASDDELCVSIRFSSARMPNERPGT